MTNIFNFSPDSKRLTVMNNLLPSNVKMHLKFDLKGSTYKRKASKHERAKKSPTYKDLVRQTTVLPFLYCWARPKSHHSLNYHPLLLVIVHTAMLNPT